MITSKFMAAAVLAAALAVPGSAQSASELLQKGIYTQETAGDLDGAIQIYRQIVASAPAQHEIAAEAQYRLAQALVRKGDLTGASLEFQKLARDYSEYQALISRMAAAPVPVVHAAVAPPASTEFDLSTSVNLTGAVTQVLWLNPQAWVHMRNGPGGAEWSIQLASPNQMVAQGATRNSLKPGDRVTVNASPAKDGSKTALAGTVYRADGTKMFDRASIGDTPAVLPLSVVLDRFKAAQQYDQHQTK
jgi:tetratricopeptide (TPR) repeat protein